MSEIPINRKFADLAIFVSPLVIGATGAMFLASYAFDEVQLALNGLQPSQFSRPVQDRIAEGAVWLTSGAFLLLLLVFAAILIGVTIVLIRDWKVLARGGALAYFPSTRGRLFSWCFAGLIAGVMLFSGEWAGSHYGEAQRDMDVMIVRQYHCRVACFAYSTGKSVIVGRPIVSDATKIAVLTQVGVTILQNSQLQNVLIYVPPQASTSH